MDVKEHYDLLIDENNDPVHDPEPLQKYMDKWDGKYFIDKMSLDKNKTVLEIGVGTGRIALKVAPLCKNFYGIDISAKTIARAKENLSMYNNVNLICGDFTKHKFTERFDVIYSSLTFMHIKDKEECIIKIASLLGDDGILVLSIDKNQSEFIDLGTRKIRIYPDNSEEIEKYILKSGLTLKERYETEFAYIFVSRR